MSLLAMMTINILLWADNGNLNIDLVFDRRLMTSLSFD